MGCACDELAESEKNQWELSFISKDDFMKLLHGNRDFSALLIKHLHAFLPDDRRGVIAVLSARVASIGDNRLGGWISYRASKAALNHFTRLLAKEEPAITAIAFRPGIVDTAMQAEIRETPSSRFPQVERWHQWHRTGQLRPPSEPALGVLWLASDFARDANGQLFSFTDEQFRKRLAVDLQVELS
mgnify:CR=1 FL=1